MHGLLRCNINTGVHARARSGRVTQRCHNSPDGKRDYRVRVISRTGSARRIWVILKKSVRRVESCLGRRRLTFACSRRPWVGAARDGGGGRWKSQSRKNVYLSPYVEEPINSKVIKSFVPELRSRYVFWDSYVLCIFVRNILCTFRVPISWLCNSFRDLIVLTS